MKNHRFLWLRNRTTDNRKCEKTRNIKEKRTIEMFNTVLKQLVELLSSQRDNQIYIAYQLRSIYFGVSFCADFGSSELQKNKFVQIHHTHQEIVCFAKFFNVMNVVYSFVAANSVRHLIWLQNQINKIPIMLKNIVR
jgi:hypothetical protein